MFGSRRDDETGGWRKHHDLYPTPSIINVEWSSQGDEMGIARRRIGGMYIWHYLESQKERTTRKTKT
jgi:hypothetical protein